MGGDEKEPAKGWVVALALAFAAGFPSLMAWVEFASGGPGGEGPNRLMQFAYAAGKLFQFSLPVLCFLLFERRWPWPGRPGFRGLALGVAFGLFVAAGMLGLYAALRHQPLFARSPGQIRAKLEEFGLDSPLGFAAFAAFVTLLHSLLEEYYWRWFVFGWLKRYLAFVPAALLSSAGFLAFHIFALNDYLPTHFWSGVVPLSLCIGVGGFVWSWLYYRTGSVYAPWVSHALVDAALFVIGYDLFFVRGR